MSFETAATVPIALNTAHGAVVTNGRLTAGESVLVQGASSGVGLMALQIARLRGASVIVGTSIRPERLARLAEFGTTLALDPRDPTLPDQTAEATSGRGVDVIIDQVWAGVAEANMKAAAIRGQIVNVGRLRDQGRVQLRSACP